MSRLPESRRPMWALFLVAAVASACSTQPRVRSIVAADIVAPPPPPPPPSPVDEIADLEPILRSDPELAAWMDDAQKRRLQVLVAVPEKEEGAQPTLRRMGYRADAEYFYPASAVKLCLATAALEKLDEMRESYGVKLKPSTPLRFVTGEGRTRRVLDTSLGRDIELALVISDNDAANRLFAFVGTEELAERLDRVGLKRTRIVQTLGEVVRGPEPMIELRAPSMTIPVGRRIGFPLTPAPPPILVGRAHVDAQGRTVAAPLDFADKNAAPLRELQDLLVTIMRPDLVAERPAIAAADRTELIEVLARLPSALGGRSRARAPTARDRDAKPLHVAIAQTAPPGAIKVSGKGGRAYGFSVENVHAVDTRTGRSFFAAATILSNENGTMNDDRYDYESVANPFISRLGVVLAQKLLGPQG
ncbi:MAG: serine hydrolase [Labilithrix sp.]|nr:serine hydrolase [Labilithrix sp.]MCW5812185.1 serine hydrolase [Labilithrix sp.]